MLSPQPPGTRHGRRPGQVRAYSTALLLLLLSTLACAPTQMGNAQPPPGVAEAMLDAVNVARSSARLCGDTAFAPTGPLRLEARLSAAAQSHSEDMLAMSTLSHFG